MNQGDSIEQYFNINFTSKILCRLLPNKPIGTTLCEILKWNSKYFLKYRRGKDKRHVKSQPKTKSHVCLYNHIKNYLKHST